MGRLRKPAAKRDRKFNVYLMIPYLSWENVSAVHEQDAISQCEGEVTVRPDVDGPMDFLAIEVEDGEIEEEGGE